MTPEPLSLPTGVTPQGGFRSGFKSARFDWASFLGTGATGMAVALIMAILAVILGNLLWNGLAHLSWRLVSTGTASDMFDVQKAGILPMVVGTTSP